MKSIFRRLTIALVIGCTFVSLTACVAPVGAGPGESVTPVASGRQAQVANSPAADTVTEVTSQGVGEDAALARLAALTKSECYGSSDKFIAVPGPEDLAKIDTQVASGTLNNGFDSKNHFVGPVAAVVSRYAPANVVARMASPLTVWLLGTVDGRQSAVAVQGYGTPAGNIVWIETMRAFATACP